MTLLRAAVIVRVLCVSAVLITFGGAGTAAAADKPLATYTAGPGWATFGLALPQGAAPTAVQLGRLPTQTDVKVRWPDDSIRFAVVSANLGAKGGTYALTAATPAQGSFVPVLPKASVTLKIGNTPFVATLPASFSDFWLRGALVSEGRAVVAPGGHPFLRVIFDVRSYASGGHRIDITVENCLDVANADQVTYDVTVNVGGATVFTAPAVNHKYLARWRKLFVTGGLQEATVTPDFTPFVAARALPEYLPTIASPARVMNSAEFGPLGFGALTRPMNAHGGRPEIAPYPDWTAQYLVHKKPDQRAYMLRHGELGGSWGIHVREADGALPTIDEYPYYWLDPRWPNERPLQGPRSVRRTGDGGYVIQGQAEPGDIAHQPSLAFVPYLVTGDRFFADEMAFWANYCLIGSYANDYNRKGKQGLLIGNEVRGIGWGLRNIGDAAAYLPDADPMKRYFAEKTLNNLKNLDAYAQSYSAGPLQTLFPSRRPEDDNPRYQPYMWISLWEQAYVAWAVDRVMQHGQVMAAHNFAGAGTAIRNRIARLQLQLFTHPEWPRDHDRQAPYLLAAGRWSKGPRSSILYFQTFSEMKAATFAAADPGKAPDLVRPFEGYLGVEARLLLMICAKLGDVGAAKSLDVLMSDVTAGVSMIDDVNRRSGWAIRLADSLMPRQEGAVKKSGAR
ncbi:MAG TPA: hypothetical protein VKE96_25955 [Vicinamibacterales bacterium]|nr:hypothetical protein [Vicinamibacterales bacterium]